MLATAADMAEDGYPEAAADDDEYPESPLTAYGAVSEFAGWGGGASRP